MIELFKTEFFVNALISSVILSLLFAYVSFFAVTKKMTFLGAGIAHTSFGGIAIGLILGINPFYSALIFCAVVAFIIQKITQTKKLSYESGIAIFFSFSMALGILLISLTNQYSFDLAGYMFGNILGVTSFDCNMAILAALIFLPFVFFFIKRLVFITFDRAVASVSGINVNLYENILLLFMVVTIVVSIKIVGIILVSALVVLPASFGILLSKDYRKIIFSGFIFSLFSMLFGLLISVYSNVPAGAAIVCLATFVYFVTFFICKKKNYSKFSLKK